MQRSILLLPSLLLLITTRSGAAQQVDSGGYVTRLGRDTIAVESFVRTKDRIEGTRVSRSPETTSIHYVASLDEGGRVTRFAAELHAGGQASAAPRWTSVSEFGPQEVVTTFTGAEGVRTIRQRPAGAVIPLLTNSFALYEQGVRLARRIGGQQVMMEIMYPGQALLGMTSIRALGHDSVAIGSFHGADAFATVDRDGRLMAYDATATVVKVQATRVAHLDVATLERQFLAADSGGRGIGPISLRDTIRAVLNEARLTVDYGRPAKRGRLIFGGLVPYDQVWRTGANAATQFFVDREVLVGDVRLRPGAYSLWTIPTPQGATLIVNSESGQWGTDYHAGNDLAKIPLKVATLDHEVERFTIGFTPVSATATELHFQWDMSDWSVPIRSP